MSTIAHLKNLLHLRSWSTFKNKNFKNDFFSWSDFCYWTKVRIKYVFNKSKAFKRNTSLFCFVTFFRANVFQVKLDKISFLFKFKLASQIIRQSNSFGSIYKTQKETKIKYMKHQKQPRRGFLQNRFYDTLTLKEMLQKYLWTSWYFREKLV